MSKTILALLVYLVIFSQCAEPKEEISLANTYWISDIAMDHEIPEFTPSLLFSIGEDMASVKSLGYEDALFESKYWIDNDYFFLSTKEGPLMRLLRKTDTELYVSLLPGDTTKFNRVMQSTFDRGYFINRFENKTLQVGMGNNNLAGVIHFTQDEALNFSNDIFNVDSDSYLSLNFYRIPYGIGFSNNIPTLAMGKSMQANVVSKPGEPIRVQNYFAGSLEVTNEEEIGLTLYQNNLLEKWRLIKVKKFEEAETLILGAWESGHTKMTFKKAGVVEIEEKAMNETAQWKLDPSGHLIIITKESGDKQYAVHNLLREKNRIGLEIAIGKFRDLIRLDR